MASSAATATNVSGSAGRRPGTRNIASGFIRKNEQSKPTVEPTKISLTAPPKTISVTSRPDAPNANRKPISRVRRPTEYTITP